MKSVQPTSKNLLLDSIQHRVLWLATYMVHYANHLRRSADDGKVGGHQTSSASVVTLMTTLYFDFLRAGDKVSIKPHASPVFHAIQYLLGNLDARYLTTLREFQGLQSYPSRTKDPDTVDFSTGSVGIGSVAPNFAALAHEYLRGHGMVSESESPCFVSLVGDAELDEGSVWEAIAEPALQGLDNVLWIVDLNRQSLDRVIPGIRARSWHEMFAANGWNILEAKYGHRLEAAFTQPGGDILRTCLDELSNPAYQRLLRLPAPQLREWLPAKSRYPRELTKFIGQWSDEDLTLHFWNLGGHDIPTLRRTYAEAARRPGPSVVFAYTLKGWGLPTVGHPQNHSALLSTAQIEELRRKLGVPEGGELSGFPAGCAEGLLCAETAARLQLSPRAVVPGAWTVPPAVDCVHSGRTSTQQVFGTILTALTRECPELARRIVTASPDVASSTNLGGWINKCLVWKRTEDTEALPPETEQSALRWTESRQGQHVELALSENNLFMALSQFGLTHELFGELLLPVGTLYDPFIRRGLDAFFYGPYSGARFIIVGTPSGITLSSEGGAHQSIGSQSIGTEMPEMNAYEPCFGLELEWIFMHALEEIRARRSSTYLRLTTRRVDQALFPGGDRAGLERVRGQVIRGAYRIVDRAGQEGYRPGENVVNLFAAGAVLPEAIVASHDLVREGIFVNVFNVTGPGPLYRDFQSARAADSAANRCASHLEELVPACDRVSPAITLIDDHPHTLAWIGGALGSRVYPIGVSKFGQSGSRSDLYREYELDAERVAGTCRRAISIGRLLPNTTTGHASPASISPDWP